MLTRVEVRPNVGGYLPLPLQDTTTGYVVRDIEGLDPVKASIVSSKVAQVDGTRYQTARRDNRNIIMKIGFEPDYVNTTITALRMNLYRFLMPKSEVTLRFFMDDAAFVDIQGRVESFETSLFSKDPEVSISILCFDPDFRAIDTTLVTGSASSSTGWKTFDYEGSVGTGFELKLLVNRIIPGFTIYKAGDIHQQFEFVAPLQAGDVVTVDSRAGQKAVTLTRAGTASSYLFAVTPASSWLETFPGSNNIRVQITQGTSIPWEIRYVAKYGGL